MIASISHNSILAAAFGSGALGRTQPVDPRREAEGKEGAGRQTEAPSSLSTDTVEFSQIGLSRATEADASRNISESNHSPNQSSSRSEASGTNTNNSLAGETRLTEEEEAQVQEFKQRDREVRQHEAAHKAAAGSSARGGPQFDYTTGPDGKRYATGGEVSIDTSEVSGDPRATVAKMQQIRRAALAPANPSGQDRAVAAQAAAAEQKARQEMTSEAQSDTTSQTGNASPAIPTGQANNTGKPNRTNLGGNANQNQSSFQAELGSPFVAAQKSSNQTTGLLIDQFV